MPNQRYDMILVGGGHNGLACAAFLAKAGKSVLVLEAEPVVGGFATTQELMPDAPGFKSTPHAIDLFSAMVPRSVVDDLDLKRYGFRTVPTDPYCTYLGPDGSSIAQWGDLDRTAAEIARYSKRDAERYRDFARILGDMWYAMLPYLQDHPKQATPRSMAETARRAAGVHKSLAPAMRILVSSPQAVLDEWFERDEVKVILGTWAAATGGAALDVPGSAVGMAKAVLCHRWGCFRAVGGIGALTQALAASATADGAEIRTSSPVEQVIVRDGAAVGVALPDGREFYADEIIGAIDPARLFTKLLDPSLLPQATQDELRALQIAGRNTTYFTGHVALAERPTLPRHGREDELLKSGYLILCPSYAAVDRALRDAEAGRVGADIPVWMSLPSVADRTLVPEGSSGESLYFMLPVCPFDLADGRDWAEEKDNHHQRVMDIIGGYAKGVQDNVIATHAISPHDMARIATKGHAGHIDSTLGQLGRWRPTPSLSGYATPIEHLWHTSAGSHPIPSVTGWAGRTAARTILKSQRGGVRPLSRLAGRSAKRNAG